MLAHMRCIVICHLRVIHNLKPGRDAGHYWAKAARTQHRSGDDFPVLGICLKFPQRQPTIGKYRLLFNKFEKPGGYSVAPNPAGLAALTGLQ